MTRQTVSDVDQRTVIMHIHRCDAETRSMPTLHLSVASWNDHFHVDRFGHARPLRRLRTLHG